MRGNPTIKWIPLLFQVCSSLSPIVTEYDHQYYSVDVPTCETKLSDTGEQGLKSLKRATAVMNKANSLQATATAMIQAKTLRCRRIRP